MTEREIPPEKSEQTQLEEERKRYFMLFNKYFGGETMSREQIAEMQRLADKLHSNEQV